MQLRLLATTTLATASGISQRNQNNIIVRHRGGGGSSILGHLSMTSLLLSSTSSSSTAAAVAAPLASTLGIHVWDRWKGSAFVLNGFKCTLSTILFGITLLLQQQTTTATTSTAIASTNSILEFLKPFSFLLGRGMNEQHHANALRMLMVSSFMGIIVGDLLWLEALSRLGAHDTILMSALHPVFAWMVGTFLLGQASNTSTILGVIMVSFGLVLTQWFNYSKANKGEDDWKTAKETLTSDHTLCTSTINSRRRIMGYLFNLTNMLLDIAGAVLIRQFGAAYNTFEICFIRFGFASIGLWLIGLTGHTFAKIAATTKSMTSTTATDGSLSLSVSSSSPPLWATIPSQSKSTWAYMSLGVFLVTYLSPALGNYALFGLPLAVWTALGSLGPVYSLMVVSGKTAVATQSPTSTTDNTQQQTTSPNSTLSRISASSVVGALLAVGGSILLGLSTSNK